MLDRLKAIARGVISFWDNEPRFSTAVLCALIVLVIAIVRAM
jgi:hypothetical protein